MPERISKELRKQLHQGDPEAFAALYQMLKTPVFTIAFRIVRSKEEAEDIMQEVFLRLWRTPPAPSVRNLRAWIFQMVHNLAIDTLRRHPDTAQALENAALTEDDVFQALALRFDLEQAIHALPCTEREILTLHLNGGLRFHEIAAIVELSVSATYRKYRKALNVLQTTLKGDGIV